MLDTNKHQHTNFESSESRLQVVLLEAVARRRRGKRYAKLAVVTVFALLGVALYPDLIDSPKTDRRLATSASNEASNYTIISSKNSPVLFELVPNIEYAVSAAKVEIVPTLSRGATIVTDEELESTFSGQAYAVLQDQNERITAFHLLENAAP